MTSSFRRICLGLGNDLDGDALALVLALLGLGGAGVSKVTAAGLLAELVLGEEVLGETESLVQAQLRLAALEDGCLIGLDGAVPPPHERADVLASDGGGKGRLSPQRSNVDATLKSSGCQAHREGQVDARMTAWRSPSSSTPSQG